MATINTDFKNQFVVKFLELQLIGLEQYAKYLNQQLKLSGKHDNWEAYKKYIEKEVIRNDKKILNVKEKLNKQ
jgi:hypothetical protein